MLITSVNKRNESWVELNFWFSVDYTEPPLGRHINQISQATRIQQMLYSPYYMSPEHSSAKKGK